MQITSKPTWQKRDARCNLPNDMQDPHVGLMETTNKPTWQQLVTSRNLSNGMQDPHVGLMETTNKPTWKRRDAPRHKETTSKRKLTSCKRSSILTRMCMTPHPTPIPKSLLKERPHHLGAHAILLLISPQPPCFHKTSPTHPHLSPVNELQEFLTPNLLPDLPPSWSPGPTNC